MGRPVVGISLGDPSGIGPEVVLAALAQTKVRRALVPLVFGDAAFAPAEGFASGLPGELRRPARPTWCAVSHLARGARQPGRPSLAGGQAQLDYVRALIGAAKQKQVDALCTAPVSKAQITRAGVPFMGHTELLGEAFAANVLMLMDGPRLKVALATNHLRLSDVPTALTVEGVTAQLRLLSRSLAPVLGRKPRIAVLGVNPHAGEGGALGREEVQVLAPALTRARRAGVLCAGPFPADGYFAKAARGGGHDVALSMFHDQGLVAAKTLDFERTVNVTLGLPVPRTSPDHGVAYDIAGAGKADPTPMVYALLKAAELAAAAASVKRRA